MPVKLRSPKQVRPDSVFTSEAIELFLEIERTPDGWRPYSERSRLLAEMLGLTNEWCVSCHVNDPSERPCWPEGYVAFDAFWKVREIRLQLLDVCGLAAEAGATNVAPPSAA